MPGLVSWKILLAVIEPPDATGGAGNNQPGILTYLLTTGNVICRHTDHARQAQVVYPSKDSSPKEDR